MTQEVDLTRLAIDRGQPSEKRPMRTQHVWSRYVLPGGLLVGFVAVVLWSAWPWLFPPRDVTVVPVVASQAVAQRSGTPLFQAAGWIEPRPTAVRVAALAPGVVEELLVVEDQPVAAGEPVARLVPDDAQLAHEGALAEVALHQAHLEEAQATLAAATTRLEQPVHLVAEFNAAQAALARVKTELRQIPFKLAESEAQHAFAKADYRGKQSAGGAVAGRVVDQAKSALLAAEANTQGLKDRRQALEAEQESLAARRDALQTQLRLLADETKAQQEAAANVKAAEAQLQQARVAQRQAKLRLDRMVVRAPVAGRVYELIGLPGASLSGSAPRSESSDSSTVITLYRPEHLQARVDVRFEDVPKVQLGQPVRINNPALDEPLDGRVLFTSSEADIQKNTLEVKVAIDSPASVFKPDMLVDVTFLAPEQSSSENAATAEMRIYIPQQLVHSDDGGSYVWVADQQQGLAQRTSIQTAGRASNGFVEVTAGLTPASRLIVDFQGLQDGDRIRVARESETPGAEGE